MVRNIVEKTFIGNKKYIEAYGLSLDDKPTSGIITGSRFTEVDTGDEYLFDETSTGTWTKVKAGPSVNSEA